MDNKIIKFNIFRYHLLPIDNKSIKPLELFPQKEYTYEELKESKNEFLERILINLEKSPSNPNPLKLEDKDEDFYLFKIAQKKQTVITHNFKNKIVSNEPFVYVVVNNNKKVQKIAISENIDAFSTTTVVKNLLKTVLKKELKPYGLNIEIEQIFSSISFWEFIKTYKYKISYLNFQYIKPNLANISGRLPEDFKKLAEHVNSHESHLTFKAPDNGVLENIEKKNKAINGLVEYSALGGGNIKVKIKGIRKQKSTDENPEFIQIREIDLEGHPEQIIKVYKSIVE